MRSRSPKVRGFEDGPAGGGSTIPTTSTTSTTSTTTASSRRRTPRSFEETAALIGVVKELSNPRCARLCTHFLKNDCLWGDQCRFSHDASELRAGAPPTEEMNFSNLDFGQVLRIVQVPKQQLKHFMTAKTRQLLLQSTGISELDWDAELSHAKISGTASQVEKAEQILRRAITHCNWGISEAKVQGLLSQQTCVSAKLLLSPTVPSLRQSSFQFSAGTPRLMLGSHSSNDIVLKGQLISRTHAQLELDIEKGSLYILDLSTNGTFLNGIRLPKSGNVAIFHGDELVFPEPGNAGNIGEFGYIVNLEFT